MSHISHGGRVVGCRLLVCPQRAFCSLITVIHVTRPRAENTTFASTRPQKCILQREGIQVGTVISPDLGNWDPQQPSGEGEGVHKKYCLRREQVEGGRGRTSWVNAIRVSRL